MHLNAILNEVQQLSADENGKAVHEQCYVKRIAASLGNPLSTVMAD